MPPDPRLGWDEHNRTKERHHDVIPATAGIHEFSHRL